jgi:hypothetical protein
MASTPPHPITTWAQRTEERRGEKGVADMWAIATSPSMSAVTVAKLPSKTVLGYLNGFKKFRVEYLVL